MKEPVTISGQPIVLYGRFPFAAAAILTVPLLVILGIATYVLATANASAAILAAQIASAIAGFVVLCTLSVFAVVAIRLRRPALLLGSSGIRSYRIELRWEDITNVEVQRYLWHRYVALRLRDPEAFLKTVPTSIAIGYAAQLKRTDSVAMPAVRGLSTQQLCVLMDAYRREPRDIQSETAADSAAESAGGAAEIAMMLASGVFAAFLIIRWMDLIGCLRAGNAGCLLGNAAGAIGYAVFAYLAGLVVLRRVLKVRPGLDLLQVLHTPQDLFGGVDPTLYDALGSRHVRREPYALRLQKGPWRAVLLISSVSSGGLLLTGALLFCSAYFLQSVTARPRIADIFAAGRPMWEFALALLLVDIALIPIALLGLKNAAKAESDSKAP